MTARKGRVLSIAGSDSGGGAGIQADIKTITALGGYAMTAITAITAQNTLGVSDIQHVSPSAIAAQIEAVLADIGADCIKTGMLARADVIEQVRNCLDRLGKDIPRIIDPVMVATSGARLCDEDAVAAIKALLIPGAAVVTPNIPEAEMLTGMQITDLITMEDAGQVLLGIGAKAVLLKGGHLGGKNVTDMLISHDDVMLISVPRIDSKHTHGTGCTLASAIATGIAQGMMLERAFMRAHAYVQEAIRTAPGFGGGHGPLNHGHTVREFDAE